MVLVLAKTGNDDLKNLISICIIQGGGGNRTPLEKSNNIEFLSNTSPDSLKKNIKLLGQHSMLGHHRHASDSMAGR